LLQGLALGGEYGGAATYVAEHVPDVRRGYYTSYIQTTASLGFFLSMGVIGTTRLIWGEEYFKAGGGPSVLGVAGWRVPFLISFLLLAVSLYIRVKMQESPLFAKLRHAGQVSVNPLKESFTNPLNLRFVLLALFGATAGQGVVWYTGQFYALTFLQTTLKVHWLAAYLILSIALALGTPFFVVFGSLSDRLGRKRIMLLGCLLAAATYVPIYVAMRQLTPGLAPGQSAVMLNDLPAWHLVGLTALVWIQVLYVTMVYGPIAAFLVELFPTRVRYTSMSLPYHLGNGWFGGFLPLIATAVAASPTTREAFGSGAIYAGLLYPVAVALVTLVIGGLFIRETRGHQIDTAIPPPAEIERFDWTAVLICLGLGFVILMVARLGFWSAWIGALALFALPTIFFRLEFPRYRSIVTVLICLAITTAVSYGLHPLFVSSGGMLRFFANTVPLGIYTGILTVAYWLGRPNPASGAVQR
jgi:MFS family permease